MLADLENYFDNNISHAATGASDQYIDLGAARDIGAGRPLYVVAIVTAAVTGDTLALKLQSDDNTSFSSATDIQTIGTFASGAAVGTTMIARLAPIATPERYIRAYYTDAGSVSAASVTCFLTDDIDKWRVYANGHTIS